MAVNTLKCDDVTLLRFKGLKQNYYATIATELSPTLLLTTVGTDFNAVIRQHMSGAI